MASDEFTVYVESLIEEIKKYPEIWNVACKQHKDRRKKAASWKKVCEALCVDFQRKSAEQQNLICQKYMNKWRNIRDQYLKTLRKRSSGTPVRPYIYSKYLSFLFFTDPLTVANPEIKPEEEEEEDEQGMNMLEDMDMPSEEEEDTEECLPPPVKRKRDSESNTLNQAACSYSPVAPEQDEDKAFFDSLIPLVKSFSMDQTLEFRIGVLNLIKKIRWSDGSQLE